nr:hypothetical protein [uncultured Rhodopila sp.]
MHPLSGLVLLFVMARLVRATYRGKVLLQVARLVRAMTVWQRPPLSSQPEHAPVVVFLLWNLLSAKKNQKTGGDTTGIGGPNDPLS